MWLCLIQVRECFSFISHMLSDWETKKTHSGLQITGTVPPQINTHQMIKQKHQEKMLVFKALKYLDTITLCLIFLLFSQISFSVSN